MQKTKKLFSVILAVVMLVSVLTVGATAAIPTISGSDKIGIGYEFLHEDGTPADCVYPGETITVNVYVTVNQANQALSAAKLQVWFNSSIYTAVSYDWVGPKPWLNPASTSSVITSASGAMFNDVADKTTEDEENGLESAVYMQFGNDNTVDGKFYVQENAATPMATITFKVSDNVAPGTATKIGAPDVSTWIKRNTSYNYVKTTNISVTTKDIVTLEAPKALTVEAAVEPSIVNPLRDGQIRFHKNGTAYAGSFDVRALAVITGDDFKATFTDVATAKTMISEIGFVFAKGENVTAPSMDAVKALVENGTAAAGYAKKTVNYISTSVEPDSYVFSCIATDIPDAEKNNSLVAVGYIAYTVDGETVYAYYPAAQTISFAGLFNTHYADAFGA